ncbi:hypothetical protein ACJIZ3_012279 [Penstemon smallii]|uniref:Uncharacterized protein n=1 Tax=Penstemon smallii TaxID=265156 RepID=A0ABD3ULK4_9LAMI
MAFLPNAAALIFVTLISLTHNSFSATDIHDLLPQYNLPKGILPTNIKSYSLSDTDGSFTVELSAHPCYVKFDGQTVYFDRIIKGKLSYGKVSGVSGIQANKFFIWVSVSGIDVNENNGMIDFHVGALSQELPAKDFETIKTCKSKGLEEDSTFSFLEALI